MTRRRFLETWWDQMCIWSRYAFAARFRSGLWWFRFVDICRSQYVRSSSTLVPSQKPGTTWFVSSERVVVTNILQSSLDLSSYALFCSKIHFMLVVVQAAVGTWILLPCWWSIHSSYLNSNCYMQMFNFHTFL